MKQQSDSPQHGPLHGVLVSWRREEARTASAQAESRGGERSRTQTRAWRWTTLLPLALALLLCASAQRASSATPAMIFCNGGMGSATGLTALDHQMLIAGGSNQCGLPDGSVEVMPTAVVRKAQAMSLDPDSDCAYGHSARG